MHAGYILSELQTRTAHLTRGETAAECTYTQRPINEELDPQAWASPMWSLLV